MKEFYSSHLDEIKAVFIISYIKDQNTLNNCLVSEEELMGDSNIFIIMKIINKY